MSDMLENAPFAERYALYNWVEDVRRLKWDDGSLTATGARYRGARASPGNGRCRHRLLRALLIRPRHA